MIMCYDNDIYMTPYEGDAFISLHDGMLETSDEGEHHTKHKKVTWKQGVKPFIWVAVGSHHTNTGA